MENSANNILKVGTVLEDKWLILEFIAKGGMGEVYRAHQLNLKRDVAIKVISHKWIESLESDEEEIESAFQRFYHEVQAMAQIRHSNVLQVYDSGSTAIQKGEEKVIVDYIVMEYVPGNTLRFTMSEEGFYPEEDLTREWIQDYFFQVLDGVEAIHEHGIVHRDLKPENVLMDEDTPKIADFGLARSRHKSSVTRSIDVKGSPAYMSPEHFFDFKKADQQADVYSLGKILFEALAGKITSETLPLKRASLPDADTPFFQKLDRIIQAATAEDKEARMKSVKELRANLLEAIDSPKKKPTAIGSIPSKGFVVSGRKKWILAAVSFVTIALVSILTLNFDYLRAERVEHQQSRVLSTGQSIAGPKLPQLDKSIPSQPRQRFREDSIDLRRMWNEKANCEVGPGQRQWW
jgi:serine/threonine-protein kinase